MVKHIRKCNFIGTKLNLLTQDKVLPNFYAEESSFNGLDLSGYTLDAKKMVGCDGSSHFDVSCGLEDTGVNIVNYAKESMDDEEELDTFNRYLNIGSFDGCYINGKLFKSFLERKFMAHAKREQYEAYKQEVFNSVNSIIDEQIGRMKR